MSGAEALSALRARFPEVAARPVDTAPSVTVEAARLRDHMLWLRDELAFDFLVFLTALDRPAQGQLELLYRLFSYATKATVVVRVMLPRDDASVETVSDIWRTAEWHERETAELFGITFANHPDPRRLLLPDDLEGYPLRKDFIHPNMRRLPGAQPMTTPTTSDEFILNVGPQHPATHGVLRVVVTMDGEVIKELVPHIGYVHRGLEKMFENRTYEQIIPFTDRTDYLSAIANNFAYVMAVERLLGMQVPQKVEYIRVIAAELNRIASHLLWLAAYGLDMGAFTPFLYAFRDREEIGGMIEEASGGRLTTNYFRVGGFVHDLPKDFFPRLKKFVKHFDREISEYDTLLIENVIFVARTRGVGVIGRERAISYGLTGPCLRASNAPFDVRRDAPYSVYEKFSFDIPTGKNGDTWDRSKVRIEEMRQSLRILRQAVDGYPEGDYRVRAPRNIEPPAGEVYTAVEGPRGEIGFFVVSDGSTKPYRVKMRKPSFSNFSALPEILRGLKIADMVAVMGSLDLVVPEMDR